MIGSVKAMVVVLFISMAVFWLARPMALRFMSEEDFKRRRNCWLALTAVAFVVPGFWTFFGVALVVLFVAAKRDPNPMALALLFIHIVPPTMVTVPSLGIRLLDFNSYRLLALAILIPALWRWYATPKPPQVSSASAAFKLALAGVLGYNLVMLALYLPYESPTNTIRRLIDYSFDSIIVFFAFYRLLPNLRVIREALMCLCLGAAIAAAIGVFEWLRYWLLYVALTEYWGIADWMSFLTRGGALRAQASTGHSMTLGFITAMAFVLWLGLARSVPDKKLKWLATTVLLVGCYASLSRAGWVMVAVGYLVYTLVGPTRAADIAKQGGLLLLGCAVVVFSPGGDKFINMLPFIGNTDTGNIDYREQLAELSWVLIWRNPWFGDPFVLRHMESLRQGQGIIDLVNVYASIALFSGFVGLFFFVTPYLIGFFNLLTVLFGRGRRDERLHSLTAVLVACMVANMMMFSVGSLGPTLTFLYWGFAALAIRVAALQPERKAVAEPVVDRSRAYTPRSQASWGRHAAR
jgi:hypothetical protein